MPPENIIDAVKLRRLVAADLPGLASLGDNFYIWLNMRDAFPHPYTAEAAAHFLEIVQSGNPTTIFAIDYQGNFAGMIGVHPRADVYRFSAEVGYWIGEPYWGKGIATQAVRLIIDYAFQILGLTRLEAGIFSFNRASMRVLEKAGFLPEGINRSGVYKNGQFYDEHRYGLVRP
jgi:RimJ/RimL family protein N-acetyltransferase